MRDRREYIFPPYPNQKAKIPPEDLPRIEAQSSHVCQRKFGGSRAVVKVVKAGKGRGDEVELFDRHGGRFVTLDLTQGLRECFLGLNLEPGVEYWLDGEYLDKKAKLASGNQAVTETIVLFDILFAGRYLSQPSQLERIDLLAEVCHHPTQLEEGQRALLVAQVGSGQLWMAETFKDEFEYHFYEFYEFDAQKNDLHPEIEGVVLRNKQFRLLNPGFEQYRVQGTQVIRCRKAATARRF